MKLTRFKQTQTGTCTLCCLAAVSCETLPHFHRSWLTLPDIPLVAPAFGLAAIPYPPIMSLPLGICLAYLHHKTQQPHAILIDNREGDLIVYDPERPELQLETNAFFSLFSYTISALFLIETANQPEDIFTPIPAPFSDYNTFEGDQA